MFSISIEIFTLSCLREILHGPYEDYCIIDLLERMDGKDHCPLPEAEDSSYLSAFGSIVSKEELPFDANVLDLHADLPSVERSLDEKEGILTNILSPCFNTSHGGAGWYTQDGVEVSYIEMDKEGRWYLKYGPYTKSDVNSKIEEAQRKHDNEQFDMVPLQPIRKQDDQSGAYLNLKGEVVFFSHKQVKRRILKVDAMRRKQLNVKRGVDKTEKNPFKHKQYPAPQLDSVSAKVILQGSCMCRLSCPQAHL
jgi:hypothetical protein